MTDRPRSMLLLALIALLALVMAACGDDDDAEQRAEDQAEDALGDQLGGECSFLGKFAGSGLEESFDPSAALGEGGEIDFGQIYGPLSEEFREVADAAPSEIKASFQTMADAVETLADELDGVKVDLSDPTNIDPSVMERLQSLDATFDADFEAASEDVSAWIEANCDISVDG